MREIKFDYIYGKKGKPETYFHKVFTLDEIGNGDHFDEICDSRLLVGYEIIARRQYTGLKNKNGVEIYEGDICTYEGWRGKVYKTMVEFKPVAGSDDMGTDMIGYADLNYQEVLGNVYENPELLDGGEG